MSHTCPQPFTILKNYLKTIHYLKPTLLGWRQSQLNLDTSNLFGLSFWTEPSHQPMNFHHVHKEIIDSFMSHIKCLLYARICIRHRNTEMDQTDPLTTATSLAAKRGLIELTHGKPVRTQPSMTSTSNGGKMSQWYLVCLPRGRKLVLSPAIWSK